MERIDQIGGLSGLRTAIDTFVDRCFDDVMIGFMFRRAERSRIKEFEFQHAAAWLGADVQYQGRPLGAAHQKHRIMGGQFARRLQILREVLEEARVPAPLVHEWIAHHESLREQITRDVGGECNDPS